MEIQFFSVFIIITRLLKYLDFLQRQFNISLFIEYHGKIQIIVYITM